MLGFALVAAVSDGEDFDFDLSESVVFEAEFSGGAGGDVEDAAGDEGASVIDSHTEAFAIAEVGDLDASRNRKGLVSG